MPEATHQTVRLCRGSHSSPSDGACVMELASMLAGERFSDHPRSVCPVIAAFLRAYNDRIGDEPRQDLYRFAALAVGTRSTVVARDRRTELCRRWIADHRDDVRRGLCRLLPDGAVPPEAIHTPEAAGTAAATLAAKRAARDPAAHEEALRLVERLIAVGGDAPAPAGPTTTSTAWPSSSPATTST